MGVPEHCVGAVLGRGGSVIKEIMQYSGARVQVSQKGEFLEGSANERIVTLSGPASAVQTAQYMVQARVQQALAQPRDQRGLR
mmetsp:Transcript_1510/g.5233  ORF Transcript_1510/g.5233 Transcript_1510/m.5233 type:complete len:83 (-) Transcript_1510:44-292(-)